jgi:HTH-type transcriptional regulator, sugar sensing transcriptional regulator
MLLQKLIDVGLDEKEAKVYVALLELGEANVAEISKKAQIKRSTVYDMLELLKEKGLLSQTRLKKRPIYYAENPKKILDDLEIKKRSMEEAMPELTSIMNLLDKKPKMRYFEGIDAVKEIFEDTLRHPDSEILTWFPYPYLNLGGEYFQKRFDPERLRKKIWMKALAPDKPENRNLAKRMSQFLVTTRFVSGKAFSEFDIEIKIYGKSKIGIISYQENLGIIIESKKIFDGFKAIFEGMWNGVGGQKDSNDFTENA